MDSKKVEKDVPKPVVAKTTYDLQRIKLEKLMKNPDKLVAIPERPKDRSMPQAPDFVRNVMGSSAGAGSGEFHVYRHLRRKEYARQKYIKEKGKKEMLEEEYHNKIEHNKLLAEAKTAKKRAKRLKKKQKGGKKPKPTKQESPSESSESENEDEDPVSISQAHESTKTTEDKTQGKDQPSERTNDVDNTNVGKNEALTEKALKSNTESSDMNKEKIVDSDSSTEGANNEGKTSGEEIRSD